MCGISSKGCNNHYNTCALTLKKIWSPDKSNFYLPQQRRFMLMGLQAYWLAVDASIKFWDKTLADILIKKQHRGQFVYPKPDKKVPHASSHYNNQKKPNQPYDARLKLNRKHQLYNISTIHSTNIHIITGCMWIFDFYLGEKCRFRSYFLFRFPFHSLNYKNFAAATPIFSKIFSTLPLWDHNLHFLVAV